MLMYDSVAVCQLSGVELLADMQLCVDARNEYPLVEAAEGQ